jgi:gas vesicle protein
MQEYPEFNDNGKNPAKIGSFVLGAVLGAGVALLLAPAHGRDTRRKVGHTVKQLGSNAKNAFQKTREGLDDMKHDAKSAIDKGRQEFMRNRRPEEGGIRPSQAPAI